MVKREGGVVQTNVLSVKTTQDLFLIFSLSCPYARQGLRHIKEQLKAKVDWNKETLEECYRSWIHDRYVSLYAGLPSIMISNLWWARNNSIFKDKIVPSEVTKTITFSLVKEFKEDQRNKILDLCFPPLLTIQSHGDFLTGTIKGTHQSVE
jgi:hypothetical protein